MIFAIDFDGTVVDNAFPAIGEERTAAIRVLKGLQHAGHRIIVWTCREGEHITEMLAWFAERGFTPNAVNHNIEPLPFAQHKIYADVYVDDRSFPPFTRWMDLYLEYGGQG